MRADILKSFADSAADRGEYKMFELLDIMAEEERIREIEDIAENRLDTVVSAIQNLLEQVPENGRVRTHSEDCWKRHTDCLAKEIEHLIDTHL